MYTVFFYLHSSVCNYVCMTIKVKVLLFPCQKDSNAMVNGNRIGDSFIILVRVLLCFEYMLSGFTGDGTGDYAVDIPVM